MVLRSVALGYGLDDRGFESRQGLGIFLYTTVFRPDPGPTQPPIQWVTGALFLGVRRPVREADHSPYLVPRSNNAWGYTSSPPVRLHLHSVMLSLKKSQRQLCLCLYLFTECILKIISLYLEMY
jgi:hypothetical protein